MTEDPFEPEESEAAGKSTREAWNDFASAWKDLFEAGSAEAKSAARNAIPSAKEEFARGLSDLAYGAAWLIHFGAAMARQAAPDPMAEGWERGAEAGKRAAESCADRFRSAKENAASEESDPDPDAVMA